MAIVFVTVKTESFTFWVNVYIRVGSQGLLTWVNSLTTKLVSIKPPGWKTGLGLFTTLLKILKDTLKIAMVNTSNSMLKWFFLNKSKILC